MNDKEIRTYMQSLDDRVSKIEESINTINHELGMLVGKVKGNNMLPMLVKYVVFPLIVIVGGLVGIKLFLPI